MKTKKIVVIAMFCALAYTVMAFLRIPVILFLKYDPKDVIITIAGFIYGPLAACIISVIVSLLEMFTVSDTGIIGAVMNVISSCAFSCTAAIIYKKRHTMVGAIIGLVTACILTTGIMILWNYLITPLYMNVPRETLVGLLIPAFLPFNLLKGGLNAAITMLLYKPISKALKRANLVEITNQSEAVKKAHVNIAVIILSLFTIATCVLLILMFQGVI